MMDAILYDEMKNKKYIIPALLGLMGGIVIYKLIVNSAINPNQKYYIGEPIDSFNNVIVYYNGMVGHSGERNVAADGYNIGMKYQCVEFVKRYYYERLHHKMPDSYGNAKDFFDRTLPDSGLNVKRNLIQYKNGTNYAPQPEDLLILDGHAGNKFGHVAIISHVTDTSVAIIQQNPGPFGKSRDTLKLIQTQSKWCVKPDRVLGWLRKDTTNVVAH
jgi:hypothetical protein